MTRRLSPLWVWSTVALAVSGTALGCGAAPKAPSTSSPTPPMASFTAVSPSASSLATSPTSNRLQLVQHWVYQLQGSHRSALDLQPLMAYPAELAVIDYSRDGGEVGEFSDHEIAMLQRSGKLVLAYMAIGAADTDRFYDQTPGDADPFSHRQGQALVAAENPDFPGTFYLRYWQPDWQAMLWGEAPLPGWLEANQRPDNYLERVLKAGFDGVYLDDIDAYQQFNGDGDRSRPTAALEMLLLIQDISRWAKVQHPGFLIVPQNGEALFQDALADVDSNDNSQLDPGDTLIDQGDHGLFLDLNHNHRQDPEERSLAQLNPDGNTQISRHEIETAYFEAIDGLGAEDFFFPGDQPEDNPFISTLAESDPRIEDFKWTGGNYRYYAQWHIPIFNVEYLTPANTLGLTQYQQVISDRFRFMNLAITMPGEAPAFLEAHLQELPLRLFAAPSRQLDQLPSISHSFKVGR